MDTQSVFNAGGVLVPNPNYTKTNGQPKYIASTDLSKVGTNPMADIFANAVGHGEMWQYKDDGYFEDYRKYGITPNIYDIQRGTLYKQLADAQPTMEKVKNSLLQTIWGEGVLGTIKAFPDLFDAIGSMIFSGWDQNYTNPISEYLGQLQEDFRKSNPIYVDPNLNISNGGLTDIGWYAKNVPSIASSLTMLIPTKGVVKGGSALIKGMNAASKGKLGSYTSKAYRGITGASKAKTIEDAKKLNGVTKWLNSSEGITTLKNVGETGISAAIMRTIENYQEAGQVYQDMRDRALDKFASISDEEYMQIVAKNADILEGVNPNDKEAVANVIAKHAADVTFTADYLNTVFDVIELVSLKNPLRVQKSMRGTRAVNTAQSQSTKAIGKVAKDAAEKTVKSSMPKRAANWVIETSKNSSRAIVSELSEGAEEAINYIAQEEGMHYGKVALGEETDGTFDGRLQSYFRSPELYESAFWGIIGGVTFQAFGSGFNKMELGIRKKLEERKNKEDSKTKEKTNTEGLFDIFQTTEDKRRVADINKRAEDYELLSNRLTQIGDNENPGTDPFNRDANDNPIPLTTETERSIARQRAIDEYINNMTFRAMDNGNFDLLKEYLRDENIRQALEEIVGAEHDGGVFVESLIHRMDEIANKYNENLITLSNIASNVNMIHGGVIPIEYLQIIARDNTYNQLRQESIDRQIAAYETSIANQKAVYAPKLDNALDYKSATQLVVLTHQLSLLKEEKAELEKDKENQGIGRQIKLDTINRNIKVIENLITGQGEISKDDALTKLLYAHVYSEKETQTYESVLENVILGNLKPIIGEENEKKYQISDETILKLFGEDRASGSYNILANDLNAAFGGDYGLNKIDKRLSEDYYNLEALNIEKAFINEGLVLNEEGLTKAVNSLHNNMLESRVEAINMAQQTLLDLAEQYGREVIASNLEGGSRINWKNDADRKKFLDALEVLNLTSAPNTQLYNNIQNILLMDEIRRNAEKATNPQGETFTTSQEQISEGQIDNPNNQLETTPQNVIEEENALNKEQTGQGQQVEQETESNIVTTDSNGSVDVEPATISSTGGQESKMSPANPQFDSEGNPVVDSAADELNRNISRDFVVELRNAKDKGTLSENTINETSTKLLDKYGNTEEVREQINKIANIWAIKGTKQGWVSDVANIVIMASSIEEKSNGKFRFTDEIVAEIETFINKYLDAVNAKQYEGKDIINFEDVLRFCNEQMEDTGTARYIYGMMKSWFEDGPRKDKYIVLDNINSSTIFDRLEKTNKELAEARNGSTDTYRVQINEFIEKAAGKAEIDKLQSGDVLEAKMSGEDIILTNNGVEVGRLPKPEHDKAGGFVKVNNGWITDVTLSDGTVTSRLRATFEDILLNKTDENNLVNKYVYQLIAARKLGVDTLNLMNEINDNQELTKYFNSLKKSGVVSDKANNAELISGLASIWGYIDLTSPDKVRRERAINYSLDLWFDKLYDSYQKIDETIANGLKDSKFVISKITNGEVIQVAANNTQGYDVCTLGKGNDAFANIDSTDIGVIEPGRAGVIKGVSKNYSQPTGSIGSIWAILSNKDGLPAIIRGHCLRFMDNSKDINDTPAGRIRNAIAKEFNRRIKSFSETGNFDELEQFIQGVLGNNYSSPLLARLSGGKIRVATYPDKANGYCIVISIKKLNGDYVNFTINRDQLAYNIQNGGVKSDYIGIDETDKFIKDFTDNVLNNTMFNADFNFFNSDADTTIPLNGFASRDKDGNFVITIPNGTNNPLVETFPSFKHFMMQGGGARWNTKNVNGSNFKSRGDNQLNNQVLNVSIESTTTRPVEKISDDTVSVEEINNGSAIEKVINKAFRHDNTKTESIERLKELKIIPNKITYTPTISIINGNSVSAEYHVSTGEIYVNDNWIELYNTNPNRALRVLIHEQLHKKLHSRGNRRRGLLNRAEEIYNDFKNTFENDSNADKDLKSFLFEGLPRDERLEEFLVESLTNKDLINYLNSKPATIKDKKVKNSIFEEIFELLSKIFDWGINAGSIYEKEFKLLQEISNESKKDKVKENKVKENKTPTYKEGELEFKEETKTEETEKENKDDEYKDEFDEDEDENDRPSNVRGSSVQEKVTSTIEHEMNNIKGRAIADGTFMKAPNGNPTNLNERQWLQVRTKAFKEWFGDWENNPDKASKVVDENGEPLVRYHQTNENITIFDSNRSDNGFTDVETPIGIFTKEKPNDIFGGKNIQIHLFVKANNILSFNTREEAQEYFSKRIPSYKEKVNYIKYLNDNDPFAIESSNSYEISEELKTIITNYLKESGFDGFELINDEGISSTGLTNVHTIVVFNPNQVKSATDNNGEFSNKNNNIYGSSIQEKTVPSVNQFIESLPIEERIDFTKLLKDGSVSIICN